MERDLLQKHEMFHTSTLRVGTIAGQVQISEKIPREITRNIMNITGLNGAASQFLQTWGIVGQVTDKSYNQWVPT